MSALVPMVDFVAMCAFALAALFAFRAIPNSATEHSRLPAIALGCAMVLYVLVSASNVLQHTGVTEIFDPYEDYLELLFAPLLILSAFAVETNARANEQLRSTRMLQQQNELLVTVIDTSPVGIMIVAPGGHVVFANDPARNMLAIREDAATGLLRTGGWSMRAADGRPTSLDELISDATLSGKRRLLVWPDGMRRQFIFSVTPMSDATESLGGAVVAVEEVGSHG